MLINTSYWVDNVLDRQNYRQPVLDRVIVVSINAGMRIALVCETHTCSLKEKNEVVFFC